ncbi:MAG TPA: hypothetical protein VMO26_02245 [Vicinamibacterales bacterium]|nr:hypothetical protein [Vicinamibacterales bacterium]
MIARVLLSLGLFLTACSSTPAREGIAAEVHDLTGAHTRVVWVQGDGTDPYAMGSQLVLMGLDTDDGRGERVILPERGSYVKPMLTPRGDRIVYSTHPELGDPSVHIVNFDGSDGRRFDRGFALAVWEDPADGSEWVYIGSNGGVHVRTVTRVRLDRPSDRHEVWNGDAISIDTFQVSPDGRIAGGLFPWPAAGVADLETRTWRQLGDGCWTALNDVGTPLFWYFDGAHRNLLMVDVNRERRWTVPINVAPGFDNPEVYHPRWARHPRFITMSGPYDQGGANQVRSGGTQAEIWLGRFNADFTAIDAWARVTNNAGGDSYPDVWIDREQSPHPVLASGRVGPAAASTSRAGAAPDRIVVDARVVSPGTVPTPDSIAPYRHALVVSRYEVVNVVEGEGADKALAVAEWAIRDARVLPNAGKNAGEVHRLTLERYEAHPELEGERLIQGGDVANLPLYYAISQ